MSNNMHYSKRASFWKNFIAAATITLSIFCNTEARVTREVAEATIPYLLEAVGIPQAQQTQNQRNAVRDMLYTDAGQRQMVNWARNGVFPTILAGTVETPIFTTENTYSDATITQLVTPIVTAIRREANLGEQEHNVKGLLSLAIQAAFAPDVQAQNRTRTAMQQGQIASIINGIHNNIQIPGATADTKKEITKEILLKIVDGAILTLPQGEQPTQQQVQQAVQAQITEATLQTICILIIRDALIGKLFPCGPGTFSSYATNSSRLGYIIHGSKCINYINIICSALIGAKIIPLLKSAQMR